MENSGSLKRISEHVDKVTLGLSGVEALLQQKSPTVREAESILKVCVCSFHFYIVCCIVYCMFAILNLHTGM